MYTCAHYKDVSDKKGPEHFQVKVNILTYSLILILLIIYNYFTGKLREFFFSKVPQANFALKQQKVSEGCLLGKIGPWNSWFIKNINFPRTYLYTILSSMKKKSANLYMKILPIGSLFYLIVPWDLVLGGLISRICWRKNTHFCLFHIGLRIFYNPIPFPSCL